MERVVIAMLRGVNVGGNHLIKMEALRELCASIGCGNPRTYVQSGNVVFGTKEKDLKKVGKRIGDAIEERFGFRADVILRTAEEMRSVISRNPFGASAEAAKLIVHFLSEEPEKEARERVAAIKLGPETLALDGRELFIYYPDGQGRSKVTPAVIEKALKVRFTGRNWNSVGKLLEMAGNL